MNYFKQTVAFLLCLILIFAPTSTLFAFDPAEIEVSSAEDLLQLAEKPQADYILTKDINLEGIDWEPIAFSGRLNGNGHTIYNLKVTKVGEAHADTIDGNNKVYDSVFAGLFSTLTDAKVENLTLRGVDVEITESRHCFVGALTGYAKNAEINNCNILDARVSITPTCKPEPEMNRISCNAGVAAVAGFGTASVKDCTVDCTLVFNDQCDPSLKVEEFLGAIVSCGNVTIENCKVAIDGYTACRGYVHNGGMVGMFYQYDKSEAVGTIVNCYVSGGITFFENNPDRRAYCDANVGERLSWVTPWECTNDFKSNEIFDYNANVSPEQCENPSLTETVHEPDCEDWGYTEHSCTTCGHKWSDSFKEPKHEPGEWKISKEPAGGVDGLQESYCTKCGKLAAEEVLKAIQSIEFANAEETLNYKDSITLEASINPGDAYSEGLVWSTSDEKVVSVDADGTIHANKRGEATITYSTPDGFAKSECKVTVKYTPRQWMIKIFLFGWIWY